MHAIKDWMLAGSIPHWAWVLGVTLLIVEDAIARSPLKANSTVQLVFDLLSHVPVIGVVLGRLGSKAVALILVLSLGACSYCSVPEHKTEPKCVAATVATRCGEPAIIKLVGQILPQVVADLLSLDFSGLIDQLVATLTHQGINDALAAVTCAVQTVDQNMAANVGKMEAPNSVVLREHAQIWLAAHR